MKVQLKADVFVAGKRYKAREGDLGPFYTYDLDEAVAKDLIARGDAVVSTGAVRRAVDPKARDATASAASKAEAK